MIGCALTRDDKRQIIEDILNAWCAKPEQRLGQLIVNSMKSWWEAGRLFYCEDAELARLVGSFAGTHYASRKGEDT